MIAAVGEREALAAPGGIVPLDHLDAAGPGDGGGVVGAVVRDHQHAHPCRQVRHERRQDGADLPRLVMRRHQHDGRGRPSIGAGAYPGSDERQPALA